MKLGLIRHGQTDWNVHDRLQGSSDIPLNDFGRQQAREAVEVLAGGGWDAIVSSPLQRARETAQIIAQGLDLELDRSYQELVERDYGQAEGMETKEWEKLWPHKIGGRIEPLDSVVVRGRQAIEHIAADFPGKNVVVVCHGTIIRYTLSDLAGYEQDAVPNGSVALVDNIEGIWKVHSVNGIPLLGR